MPVDFKGHYFARQFFLSAGPLIEPGVAEIVWQLTKTSK